ncbi:hypothetical protein [Phaeobacter sp.]|uniref:hypothetical protein n=1 Tax=Phaeobacter sp. TaxID=1902409 RepID=UPI0025D3A470|nr:hypothetical protein [Phaeobacter sp.]
MLDRVAETPARQVFDTARRAEPAQALEAICLLATGRDGFLAGASHAIHRPGAPLMTLTTAMQAPVIRVSEPEPGIACFDLVLSQLQPMAPQPIAPKAHTMIVALRAGLLARTLDQAFAHLCDRESLGQKTLHHQLVKTQFSRTWAFLSQLRRELVIVGNTCALAEPDRVHNAIDTHLLQSSKLMGGHGLRDASAHGLEYLSLLIRATLASQLVCGQPVVTAQDLGHFEDGV